MDVSSLDYGGALRCAVFFVGGASVFRSGYNSRFDVPAMPRYGRGMMDRSAHVVRPGGRLRYA